ncbi:PepSY domain-containing protein [Flavobacterium sp. LC2016-12]|uniref:PepSY-associated TM helix domain-containing protein n=1 Tax=Flavobacterium sp. LC2016-12 TaxID=2783794 RepID=UPI00188AC544|nr:PepSY-associated TM helix domain-containing protein [Flavobacterium sp. LC2016-12]MBF4463617.1 PepSY domain-containing protein [Flavobacterium sp. LC2016-12]
MTKNPIRKTEIKTKQKSKWSKLNHWLHLWLGLSSGIIVFIVSLTGVLFIFCDDIIDGLAYDSLYVSEVKEQRLSPEEILAAFKKQLPDRKASYFITYRDPERTIKLASSTKERDLQFSWIDPYTGKILTSGKAYDFFYVIAHIHSGHIPFGDVGNLIVEISVWIFLIELITGLILWWPKKWNKSTKKQSFSIKTNASFKRLNYDLHNVPGFYNLLPALFITITGLIIVNKTLNKTTHKIFDGMPRAYAEIRDLKPEYDSTKTFAPISPIVQKLFSTDKTVEQVKLSVAAKDSITSLFAVAAEDIGLKGIQNGKTFSINRYTGQEIEIPVKVMNGLNIDDTTMNLHIGFWAGWIGKILTLAVGLVCMFLPVTGFLIWYGRRNKKKKPQTI